MLDKKCISFTSGFDMYQICLPILQAFKFQHFTYCREFTDGSRAILTTTPESLYELYLNKQFIFENLREKIAFNLAFSKPEKIQYYFFSEKVGTIPKSFAQIREACLRQMRYERERQNIGDRFIIEVSYKKYREFYIFFIPVNSDYKNLYINNLDLLNHFRAYFLDKAHTLILKAEKDKILKPLNTEKNEIIQISSSIDMEKILNLISPSRYYISDQNEYLTKKQMLCAAYIMKSYSAKQIAKETGLSYRTIENHVDKIKEKFHCSDRSELIKKLFSAFPAFNILLK